MKEVLTRGLLVLAVFGSLLLYWDYADRKTNRLLPQFAGCFRGTGALQTTSLIVKSNGTAQLYGSTVPTRLVMDKIGYSFEPSKAIVFDSDSPTRLMFSSPPMLLRISPDRQSLTIPGDGAGAILRPENCPPEAGS